MKIVAYYRVSTRKQGESGLGLDAQREEVTGFSKTNHANILAEYVEVETGKRKDRPRLSEALCHAALAKATLVIAKLDRLARNVAFISALMESKVDFVCCDNPHATPLTIHIHAAVAEDEARRISERTKAALQAAKVRGVKLGSARPGHWEGREHLRGWRVGTKAAIAAVRQRAKAAYGFLVPTMKLLRDQGASYDTIAEWLNEQGHLTRAGKAWTRTAAWRVLQRSA